MICFGWLYILKLLFWINLIVVIFRLLVKVIVSVVGVDLDKMMLILIFVVLIKIFDEICLLKINILFWIVICCWI